MTPVLVTVTPEGRDFSPAGLSPLTRLTATLSPFPGGEGLGVRGSHRYGRVETLPFRRFNSDALLRHEVLVPFKLLGGALREAQRPRE